MGHHQHHGLSSESHFKADAQTQSLASNMPAISEDDIAAEVDEPPDYPKQNFTKTRPPPSIRRQSLLTKALHTDSEYDEERNSPIESLALDRSRSSTCSTYSGRSTWDFTSDDGHVSHGTRASTPGSPPLKLLTSKLALRPRSPSRANSAISRASDHDSHALKSPLDDSEPVVEAQLGRRRCIQFACGQQPSTTTVEVASPIKPVDEPKKEDAAEKKRPCALKFLCPSRAPSDKPAGKIDIVRKTQHSPPPAHKSGSPLAHRRSHRGSDSTIKLDSPKSPRSVRKANPLGRHQKITSELERSDGMRFHEFASSEEEIEDWVKETTVHKARLTVHDTLQKENVIRKLGEQVEEEALEEEDILDEEDEEEDETELEVGSANEGFSDDDLSDGGFQTDDEEGFAESDDESDGDSDYEWWTAGKSGATSVVSTIRPLDSFRPSTHRKCSDSTSSMSDSEGESPKSRRRKKKLTHAIDVPAIPDLPDSTDFVCGTLDEDRPLEAAYISCIQQRKAAKHRATPQDIDPTFPTSDPELEDDDEEDEVDELPPVAEESDANPLFLGKLDNLHGAEARGRRTTVRKSPRASPQPHRLRSPPPPAAATKRLRSPPPPAVAKRGQVLRSPPPRALFGHSPRRLRSPAPAHRVKSPPPSRRASPTTPVPNNQVFADAFLGERPELMHTASLPRSPRPFGRHRKPSDALAPHDSQHQRASDIEADSTTQEVAYRRSAIDIVQGLERKRLRRRQKYYEKHCRKEEKKEKRARKPQPGKGAQRMRQVGIECAIYRGKRVLSV